MFFLSTYKNQRREEKRIKPFKVKHHIQLDLLSCDMHLQTKAKIKKKICLKKHAWLTCCGNDDWMNKFQQLP